MKRIIYITALALFAVSGCGDDSNKEKYTVIKDNKPLLGGNAPVVRQYSDVLAKDPKNLQALVGLGNKYFDTGEHRKAVEMYTRALKINPNDANVRTDLGVMYRRLGEFDNAIREFRKAADIDKRHIQSRFNLGIVYNYDKKDRRKAADAWEEVLKINPSHPQAAELRRFIDGVRGASRQQGLPAGSQKDDGWIK